MKRFIRLAAIMIGALALAPVLALAGQDAQQQSPPQPQKFLKPAAPDRGQQVFAQNCSRCHLPPEGFSPRISGTIALHMRVRANLSEQDYKALLHFLNP